LTCQWVSASQWPSLSKLPHTPSSCFSIGITEASAGAASLAQCFTAFIGFTGAVFPGGSDFQKGILALPVQGLGQVLALFGILSILGGFCHVMAQPQRPLLSWTLTVLLRPSSIGSLSQGGWGDLVVVVVLCWYVIGFDQLSDKVPQCLMLRTLVSFGKERAKVDLCLLAAQRAIGLMGHHNISIPISL
jgi:hypothetical protein